MIGICTKSMIFKQSRQFRLLINTHLFQISTSYYYISINTLNYRWYLTKYFLCTRLEIFYSNIVTLKIFLLDVLLGGSVHSKKVLFLNNPNLFIWFQFDQSIVISHVCLWGKNIFTLGHMYLPRLRGEFFVFCASFICFGDL